MVVVVVVVIVEVVVGMHACMGDAACMNMLIGSPTPPPTTTGASTGSTETHLSVRRLERRGFLRLLLAAFWSITDERDRITKRTVHPWIGLDEIVRFPHSNRPESTGKAY